MLIIGIYRSLSFSFIQICLSWILDPLSIISSVKIELGGTPTLERRKEDLKFS